jgi:hypothetical protein
MSVMARNRKNQSSAVRFVPAMKAILLCMLIGGSGVGYVLQKNKIYELGRQITKREAVLERLKWENKVRANQLANLQMPARLLERVKELNSGLVMPQPGQTIWLVEPAVEKQTNAAASLFVLGK